MNPFEDQESWAMVAQGYLGTDRWCYWDAEDPQGGSCGPFDNMASAVDHALTHGYTACLAPTMKAWEE